MTAGVDTSFDYHDDSDGKDPDKYSPTLRRHHKILWSKELPKRRGTFCLAPEAGSKLTYQSPLGIFRLSSDAITTRLLGKAMHTHHSRGRNPSLWRLHSRKRPRVSGYSD